MHQMSTCAVYVPICNATEWTVENYVQRK